jgi:hypothetical protein
MKTLWRHYKPPAVGQTLAGGSHGLGCGPCARKKAQGGIRRVPPGRETSIFAAYPGLRPSLRFGLTLHPNTQRPRAGDPRPGAIILLPLWGGHLRWGTTRRGADHCVGQTLAGGSHGLTAFPLSPSARDRGTRHWVHVFPDPQVRGTGGTRLVAWWAILSIGAAFAPVYSCGWPSLEDRQKSS